MILERKVYDRVWWGVAVCAAAAVTAADSQTIWRNASPYLLLVALVSACCLAFGVQRGTEKQRVDLRELGLTAGVERLEPAAQLPEEESVLADPFKRQQIALSFRHVSLERSLQNTDSLSKQVREMTDWLRKTQLEPSTRRRNVLMEASDLAQLLQGKDFAVHISPENDIAICRRDVSIGWERVGQEFRGNPEPLPRSDRPYLVN